MFSCIAASLPVPRECLEIAYLGIKNRFRILKKKKKRGKKCAKNIMQGSHCQEKYLVPNWPTEIYWLDEGKIVLKS